MIKLSIIVPSISPDKWLGMYNGVKNSCKNHEFELIFVGPSYTNDLDGLYNIKYVKDLGCPSRCLQIGSLLAEGEYIAWAADDYLVEEKAFDLTFEYLEGQNVQDDGINLLYTEGVDFSGNQDRDPSYWIAHTHADLRHPGVMRHWTINPVFMYRTETWYKFGGLDCSFEHVNMNAHDLAFSIQAKGGRIIKSPVRVYRANWKPWNDTDKHPIQLAWEENDRPRFYELYQNINQALERRVDLNNWKNSAAVWPRRNQK